jgi:hypothetical protein
MSTTTKSTHHAYVVLKLPANTPALITYGKSVVKAMSGNPSFPNPTPTLAEVSAGVDDLQAAETATRTRVQGAASARDDKRAALVRLLRELQGYIQKVANASPENGATIIQSAGVSVRKTATRRARAFIAKPGAVSGTAKIVAVNAARRASYEWQYSTDGGKSWLTAPVTLRASTTIAGLAPGATVLFKYRAVTTAGEGDWSQPVSLLIS